LVYPAEFVASNDIRYRRIEGCVVVLDLRAQSYSVLDELASSMWEIITGEEDSAACVSRWAHEYETTNDEIAESINQFCEDRLRMGWLRSNDAAGSRNAHRHAGGVFGYLWRILPNGALAFSALAFTALSLRFAGFRKTYGWLSGIRAMPAPDVIVPMESIVRPFLTAENFVLLRRAPNDCLVRSLALFLYLCWSGIPAKHVIGVRRVPFAAHAWVEVSGEAVLGPAPRGFSALATLRSRCDQ
jgi:hypothetical protein